MALGIALVVLALAQRAAAHAGHFHLCPDTPSGRGYIRREVGSCTSFTSLNASSPYTITGKVTVWVYAYKNCSDNLSSALEFSTTISKNGVAQGSINTTGTAFADTCATPNKSVYMNDTTLGDDDANIIFWHPALTTVDGVLCGNAANSFVIRSISPSGQAEANSLKSVVVNLPDGYSMCCDLAMVAKPALTDITSATTPCAVASPPPPTASPPPPPPSPPPRVVATTGSPGSATALRMPLLAALGAALLSALLLLA